MTPDTIILGSWLPELDCRLREIEAEVCRLEDNARSLRYYYAHHEERKAWMRAYWQRNPKWLRNLPPEMREVATMYHLLRKEIQA